MRKNAFRKLCLGTQSRLLCDFFKPRYALLFLQTQELHNRRFGVLLLQPGWPDMRCLPNSLFLNYVVDCFVVLNQCKPFRFSLLKDEFLIFL